MNLNGDEKRIRQLFGEMSAEEQRHTPEFAAVIAAARSSSGRAQSGTRLFALACVAPALVTAIIMGVMLATRYLKTQPQPGESNQVVESPPSTQSAPPVLLSAGGIDTPRAGASKKISRPRRHRPHLDELAIRMRSLAQWQSPTASLLKTSREEMSLPRLGESLLSIKIFSPNDFN